MQRPGGLLVGAGKEVAYATLLTSLQIMTQKKNIRRQDALMNLLQACIDVLFFHHPAASWISGQFRAEREHCADDLAVRILEAGHAGSRLSYATPFLALEERRQIHALALAANGGSLLDRIRRLAGVEEQPASPVRPLAAAAMASLLLAVLVTAAAPIREARADELPKDTNQIESLTVEQAKKLVEEFPGVTVDVQSKGFGPYKLEKCLPVNGLKKLTPDVAQALAGYSKGPLFLNGLTTLDAETAKALAGFKGQMLDLSGLTVLSDVAAKALAQHKGYLSLDGLTTLSDEAATALAQHEGPLSLNGLTTLSVEAAKALAQHEGPVSLNGLTTLSAEAAKALAHNKGYLKGYLSLNGLTTLSDKAAKALAQYKGILYLNGLTTLSEEAAKALAQHEGPLSLNGLTTLSDEAAKALAQHEGGLSLDGLTTLSDEAAKALAQYKGDRLHLDGLTTLSAEAATALAQYKGGLSLNGVTALDSLDAVAIAQALATRKGPLSLPNLKKISPKTLTALIEKEDVEIPLIETLELIQEPDGSPTDDFVIPEGFRQR